MNRLRAAALALTLIALSSSCTPGLYSRDVTAVVSGPTRVAAGSTIQLTVRLEFSDGFTRLLTPTTMASVDWTTSDAALATVNFQGIVTGIAPGSVTITATPALTATGTGERIPGNHALTVE